MPGRILPFLLFAALIACVCSASDDLSRWDPRMAAAGAVVDTNGVKWIDGKLLPIEGRWTEGDAKDFYCRLPDTLSTNVNEGVRYMRRHTAGMQFRFRTDSPYIIVRYLSDRGTNINGTANQNGANVVGWDCYRYDRNLKRWVFAVTAHNSQMNPTTGVRAKRFSWKPGDDCLVNLPSYGGIKFFEIGVAKNSKVEAPTPRASGVTKPVVFYGTSITHGGCASRPGLAFVNLVGRNLDVPVRNLGFSGSGIMELEMSEHLAKIDASCYVLDCLWNMPLDAGARRGSEKHIFSGVRHNYEPFVRNLRRLRPSVPIVLAEQCDDNYHPGRVPSRFQDKNDYVRALYEKLLAEGWTGLVYLSSEGMATEDSEGTVDNCHPNDHGMLQMAKAFGAAVAEALGLKRP